MNDELQGTDDALSWRSIAAWIGSSILGLVLLVAAWGKALDPVSFAQQITHEGLDFLISAGPLAWLVVVGEVVLGFALLLGLRTRLVLVPTGLLIVIFLFLTSRSYWRWAHGMDIGGSECGCFGNLVSRTPAEAFWQDLFLLVPSFSLCFLDETRARARYLVGRWSLVGLAGIGAGIMTFMAPGLPLDDLATRLSPGVAVDEICAGSTSVAAERICLDLLLPELASGQHVVVIDDLDSEVLAASIDDLNELAGDSARKVWLVVDASDDERQMFFWQWGPLFEVREVPDALLQPLYRTKPRSFLVADGAVVETWSGMPELATGPGRL